MLLHIRTKAVNELKMVEYIITARRNKNEAKRQPSACLSLIATPNLLRIYSLALATYVPINGSISSVHLV